MDCFAALAMTTGARVRATRSLAMTTEIEFAERDSPSPSIRVVLAKARTHTP
jgi:hypothetical protein